MVTSKRRMSRELPPSSPAKKLPALQDARISEQIYDKAEMTGV
jgi:hypothetical protein